MNDDVGFFCKSFAPDFVHLSHLLKTFAQHNPDNLLLTLSLPERDLPSFNAKFGPRIRNVQLVADESYCGHDLMQYRGWHGQQICKLMSWQVVAAEHYAVLDSDCYFIRDIRAGDIRPQNGMRFVACGSSIRTVLKEGNDDLIRYIRSELPVDPASFPQRPKAILDRLDEFVGFKDLDQDNPGPVERSDIPFKVFGNERWLFYQPGQFFSNGLLQRMCQLFAHHHLTVGEIILICPWEYNWYGEFAATHGFEETQFRVSPFVHFQDEAGLEFAKAEGITEAMLRSRFALVQMAARHLSNLAY